MGLLTSKKFAVAIAAIVVAVGGRYGLDLETEDLEPIIYTLIAWILAQGVADAGKEKAKIEADAAERGVTVARLEMTTIPPPLANTNLAGPLERLRELREEVIQKQGPGAE